LECLTQAHVICEEAVFVRTKELHTIKLIGVRPTVFGSTDSVQDGGVVLNTIEADREAKVESTHTLHDSLTILRSEAHCPTLQITIPPRTWHTTQDGESFSLIGHLDLSLSVDLTH
jgi:hypothetical protein